MASLVARRLRNNPTDAERCLWRHLRRRQLDGFRFRRQLPIGQYVVDFVCLAARLVIEVDGGQHAEQHVADEVRSAWLRQRGFRVLRFWNNEVLGETEAVLARVREALQTSSQAPPP